MNKRKKTPPKELEKASNTVKKALHVCKYCSRDISRLFRIKCAVCPGFCLCLPCFSIGAEIAPHKSNHPYHIHGDLGFPLYDLNWTADEEMSLLEAIDMSGLGNWSAVATHIGSKTAEECKAHYFEVFLRSPSCPFVKPEMEGVNPLTVMTERKAKAESAAAQSAGEAVQAELGPDVKSEAPSIPKAEPSQGALRPPGVSDSALVDVGSPKAKPTALEALQKVQPATTGESPGVPVKVSGQAKRQRIEKALADTSGAAQTNAAQQTSTRGLPMARMVVDGALPSTPLPGATETLLNPAVVSVAGYDLTGYHTKRQEFDHEYDNDAELLISEISFLPTDTPEETEEKLQLCEVYNQRLTERENRRDIVVSQGLFQQKKHQAWEKKTAVQPGKELTNSLRVFARFVSQPRLDALTEGFHLEEKLRHRLMELNNLRRNGVRNWDDAEVFENDQRKRAAEAVKTGNRNQRYLARTGTDEASIMSQAAVVSLGMGESGARAGEVLRLHPATSATRSGQPGFVGNAAAQLAAWRARRGVALDITALPGSEHLLSKERALCLAERLLPSQYLAYKASFLREAQRNGGKFPRQDAKYMFRLKSSTSLKVFDLLVSSGWISTGTNLPGETAETGAQEEATAKTEDALASPAHSNSMKP